MSFCCPSQHVSVCVKVCESVFIFAFQFQFKFKFQFQVFAYNEQSIFNIALLEIIFLNMI